LIIIVIIPESDFEDFPGVFVKTIQPILLRYVQILVVIGFGSLIFSCILPVLLLYSAAIASVFVIQA